ncbi:MAG: PAS domain S-box protein [Actinomycetota bacterium]
MTPLTILLIDDSETERATYRRFLNTEESERYRFVEFERAEAALEWCQSHTPDVILLDEQLPDLDGLEFLNALQTQTGETQFPLLLLTVDRNLELTVEAIKRGAQDYLDKSNYTATDLQIRVQGVLERSRLQQRLRGQQERQHLVATTALRIRQSLNLPDILQTAVEEVRSLLATDRVVLYRFSPDWEGEVVVESVGAGWKPILGEVFHDPCLENHWAEPYRQGSVTYHTHIPAEGLADCYVQLLQPFQVQANLVVPILQDKQLWGLLIAHQCSSPRQWQDQEIELLQALSVQLSIAIQQAELQENLQRELINRQETEIRFQKIFEQSPEGKIRFDPNGFAIAANQAWEGIWQAPAEVLAGYNILQDPVVASDGHLPAVMQAFAGETVTLPPFYHEPSQVNRLGRARWVDMVMYPLKSSTGQVLEVILLIRDITERITAEQQQQRLVQLIENSPNFIGIATLEGQVTFVNAAGQALFGLEPEQVTQTTIWDYQIPELNQRFQSEIIATVLATGQWQGEFEMRHFQTGELIPVWSNIFRIADSQTKQPEAIAAVVQDLRQIKQTELLIKQQSELLNLAYDAVIVRDSSGKIIFWNQGAENLYGWTKKEAVNQVIHTLLQTQFPISYEATHATLWEQGYWEGELIHTHRDGRKLITESRHSLLRNSQGQPLAFLEINRDITARKQVEKALKENEQKLRLLIKYAPASITMFDQKMCYIMASNRWIEDYQLASIDAIIGRSHYDIFPEIPERWKQIHRRCLAGATEKCDEDVLVRANGLKQWLRWEIHPWYTAETEVGGIILLSEDITARKQVEEALWQSEARLRLAQTVSKSGVWDWDIPTNTIFWSPEYYQLYRLEPSTPSTYENWLRCIHPDDREKVNQSTLQVLKEVNTELRIEYRVISSEELRWFAGIGQVFRDESGAPIRVIGIVIDITQQKQTEIALQTLNSELEQRVTERTSELTTLNNRLLVALEEQVQARELLRQSEESRRLVLEFTHIGSWDWHLPSGKLIWNDNHFTLLGLRPGSYEPTSEFWHSRIHPDDRDWVAQRFSDSLKYQTDYIAEHRIIRSDGVIRWMMARARGIYNEMGKPLRSLGVLLDITDRKQAELALQQQTRLEQLRWQITQAIRQSLDLSGILNTAVEQIRLTLQVDRAVVYHFQPDWTGDFIAESLDEGWMKLVDSNIHKVWEDTYLQQTQGGRFQNHETFVIPDIYQAGLQSCHIELLEQFQVKAYVVVPIFVGKILWGLLGIYQNTSSRNWEPWEIELLQQVASQLTIAIQQSHLYNQLQVELQERKQAQAVLQEAERRWRSLLDNVQLLVVGLDRFGNINYINPFCLHLMGYTHLEIWGKNWLETCIPPSQQPRLQTAFSEFLTQSSHSHYQNSILTKAGEERVISWNNTQLQNTEGAIIGCISIGEDITERCRIEKMKSEFLSIVSHELRTPLTSISGALELLASGLLSFDSERGKQSIEIAANEADRLIRLVNDILDLERLESGKVQVYLRPYNLADLMYQAIEFMQLMADHHQITLSLTPLSVLVNVDSDRILQVLTNLLNNAIKFSDDHSTIWLTAEIMTDAETAGSYACVTVRDRGRGIPADKLEAIFDRFQQVDASDSRKKGGTGLGLAICRTIVQQHGCRIWAESTLGQGSQLRFTLPLTAPSP